MKSGLLGMLLVFCLIACAVAAGGDLCFLNVPSLVICIGMPIGLAMASAGASDLGRSLRALRCLLVSPRGSDRTARNAQVLRHMISYAYAAGVIGTMIGWVQILRQATDLLAAAPGFALSLLTILYSIIISECILRPAARRIEAEPQSCRETGTAGPATELLARTDAAAPDARGLIELAETGHAMDLAER